MGLDDQRVWSTLGPVAEAETQPVPPAPVWPAKQSPAAVPLPASSAPDPVPGLGSTQHQRHDPYPRPASVPGPWPDVSFENSCYCREGHIGSTGWPLLRHGCAGAALSSASLMSCRHMARRGWASHWPPRHLRSNPCRQGQAGGNGLMDRFCPRRPLLMVFCSKAPGWSPVVERCDRGRAKGKGACLSVCASV